MTGKIPEIGYDREEAGAVSRTIDFFANGEGWKASSARAALSVAAVAGIVGLIDASIQREYTKDSKAEHQRMADGITGTSQDLLNACTKLLNDPSVQRDVEPFERGGGEVLSISREIGGRTEQCSCTVFEDNDDAFQCDFSDKSGVRKKIIADSSRHHSLNANGGNLQFLTKHSGGFPKTGGLNPIETVPDGSRHRLCTNDPEVDFDAKSFCAEQYGKHQPKLRELAGRLRNATARNR